MQPAKYSRIANLDYDLLIDDPTRVDSSHKLEDLNSVNIELMKTFTPNMLKHLLRCKLK